MKKIIMSVIALAIISMTIGFVACNKEKENKKSVLSSIDEISDNQECKICDISYNDVTESEKDMIMKYLSSSKNVNEYDIIGSIPTETENLNLTSYALKQNGTNSDYLVISFDEKTKMAIYSLPTKVVKKHNTDNTETYTIEMQKNGKEYFDASFEYNLSDSTFRSLDSLYCYGPTVGNSIAECVRIALHGCFHDLGCAMFCAGYPEICLSTTTLACTIHHLKGGASEKEK